MRAPSEMRPGFPLVNELSAVPLIAESPNGGITDLSQIARELRTVLLMPGEAGGVFELWNLREDLHQHLCELHRLPPGVSAAITRVSLESVETATAPPME